MRPNSKIYTPVVAALLLGVAYFANADSLAVQNDKLDQLFAALQNAEADDWRVTENKISEIWSHSGSDSMDLLLERGRQAMKDGDFLKAIEHFTALTDHAPDFAEGWNARANAFFQMEEYGLAIHDIEMALSLNPRHFGAMSGLGTIFEIIGKPMQALDAYSAALAVHPHRPDILQAVKRLKEKTAGKLL